METEAFSRPEMAYAKLMYSVLDEIKRAEAKFPNQSLPWGGDPGRYWALTGPLGVVCNVQRAVVDAQLKESTATWLDVIFEEVLEAGAETGQGSEVDRARMGSAANEAAHSRLRAELIQVAAMALRACADLDVKAKREDALMSVAKGESRADWVARYNEAGGGPLAEMGPDYRLLDNGEKERMPGPNYRLPDPGSHPLPPTVEDSGDLDLGDFASREAPYPAGGKHSGDCRCKACAEPDEEQLLRVTGLSKEQRHDLLNYGDDDDLPPNAGSAS